MKRVERRASTRFNVDPVLCRMVPTGPGLCVLRNVSLNGAFFLNHTPPDVGSKVKLEFTEWPLSGYKLVGEVVRHGLGTFRGFAVFFPIPRPRLLRAVYHGELNN